MKVYPNAKINIGLDIIRKRNDGFHELETLMLPIPLCDELSFEECSLKEETTLTNDGICIDGDFKSNLVYKAYTLLKKDYKLPNLTINLKKNIPFGAGLGGGSADASFMLNALNTQYNLNISVQKLEDYAATLGSDCPIFIKNKAAFAKGRGEILETHPIKLEGYTLILIIPNIAISTQAAYQMVTPAIPEESLKECLNKPITTWNDFVKNDFEHSVFTQFPATKEIKTKLYKLGATYASLSGSGAAVFGIFDHAVNYQEHFPKNYFSWHCNL